MNSRYGFTPYDSLANYWFKPLTHHSGEKNVLKKLLAGNDIAIRPNSNQGAIGVFGVSGVERRPEAHQDLVIFREDVALNSLDHRVDDPDVHLLNAV